MNATQVQITLKNGETHNIDFYRINNDYNGNPRFIVWFAQFLTDDENAKTDVKSGYNIASNRAHDCGFKKYRGKDFGGGFVCQSYSLRETANSIKDAMNKAIK